MLAVDAAFVLQVEELGASEFGAGIMLEPIRLYRIPRKRPVAHRIASAENGVGKIVV